MKSIIGGAVITMDPDRRIIEDGVVEDQHISDVGPASEVHPPRGSRIIDAVRHGVRLGPGGCGPDAEGSAYDGLLAFRSPRSQRLTGAPPAQSLNRWPRPRESATFRSAA